MLQITHIGSAVLLVAGLLVLYAEPLAGMVSLWNGSPMYSYAFSVAETFRVRETRTRTSTRTCTV